MNESSERLHDERRSHNYQEVTLGEILNIFDVTPKRIKTNTNAALEEAFREVLAEEGDIRFDDALTRLAFRDFDALIGEFRLKD